MAIANSGRARILDRIRKAQVVPDPAIDARHVSLDEIFPALGDPLQRFLAECETNLIEVRQTQNAAESKQALADLLAALPSGSIYVQDDPQLRRLAPAFENREVMYSSAGRAPEACQASITLCEGLVAQTGSILASSRTGGRGGSIIPPTHIVYATSDQIVADITTALRNAMAAGLTDVSYFGLISGSSRTADIEKILVQGAHGPRKVAIVLEMR